MVKICMDMIENQYLSDFIIGQYRGSFFTTISTARYQIQFFSGTILDKKGKSAWLKIWKNRQRIARMHIWKLDTQKLVAKMMKQKTYFHLKVTMVKYIFTLERFNKHLWMMSDWPTGTAGLQAFGDEHFDFSV